MSIDNVKFNETDGWSTTLKRRYILLRNFLFLSAAISPVFVVLNYLRGVYFTAIAEVFLFSAAVILLFLIRKPDRLKRLSFFFVIICCILAVIASSNSGTHPTVAAWNSLCVLFAFYLLGRKKGMVVTFIFVPVSTVMYVMSHISGPNAIPFVAVMNIIFFMLCISWIAFHYESTREETEKALIEDIDSRIKTEKELEATVEELKSAYSEVNTLSGLLPICASCKKIRDDRGYWTQIELYIKKHSDAEFSHGICPECAKKYYPDLVEDEKIKP